MKFETERKFELSEYLKNQVRGVIGELKKSKKQAMDIPGADGFLVTTSKETKGALFLDVVKAEEGTEYFICKKV